MAQQEPSRQEIWKMFDQISPTYDRVNRIMTGGLDRYWRKKMGCYLPNGELLTLLDCATGTGDQIIALMQHHRQIRSAVGIDLASEMVEIGRNKMRKKPYAEAVEMRVASALEIPYPDASFDCVTIAFGIRNVTDVVGCLKEFKRVLKPGGCALILEGSIPQNRLLRHTHLLYLRHLLPWIGGIISKKKQAYQYLNQTIETFPSGEQFVALMREAGFDRGSAHPLTGGVVTIYRGEKGDAA